MSCRRCERCGAQWFNGMHFWSTGKPGSDLDLAGLVCDVVKDPRCQNPLRGMGHEGDTWEKRRAFIDGATEAVERTTWRMGQEA